MNNDLLYLIALKNTPLVGDITAKKLINYFGSAENVFAQKKQQLERVGGIGSKIIEQLLRAPNLLLAENELRYAEKNNISIITYTDKVYPALLRQCVDSPILYYQRGRINLHNKRVLSIVGTRNATAYGCAFCEKLIEDLAYLDVVIVSGYAYGVDITAHKAAIKHRLQTVACLAHGLNITYPAAHSKYNHEVEENGGFITDFGTETKFDRKNFLSRNRLIAGLSEATVVIESGNKGGSLVTADIAYSYERELFALPGRTTDAMSIGCNELIRSNKALMVTSAKDIINTLKWDTPAQQGVQQELFIDLTADEQIVYDSLLNGGKQSLDALALDCQMPIYQVSNLLFQLEIKNLIQPLPGKYFELK
jgi:DNA protecting protein dprA